MGSHAKVSLSACSGEQWGVGVVLLQHCLTHLSSFLSSSSMADVQEQNCGEDASLRESQPEEDKYMNSQDTPSEDAQDVTYAQLNHLTLKGRDNSTPFLPVRSAPSGAQRVCFSGHPLAQEGLRPHTPERGNAGASEGIGAAPTDTQLLTRAWGR
ncbi:hypothetical protein QTO34_009917 [Cnephaeus nilssonii]|uniref:Uncharacterized protein n=1 Tax=Cnephaeus nilssonii TaxID=3371016 RepID=A0AA40HEJ7_CNENI|nr:hypothetical protein QTO34_009917 [Eptesicus nilssonii]